MRKDWAGNGCQRRQPPKAVACNASVYRHLLPIHDRIVVIDVVCTGGLLPPILFGRAGYDSAE
jgi:hypothetical protein